MRAAYDQGAVKRPHRHAELADGDALFGALKTLDRLGLERPDERSTGLRLLQDSVVVLTFDGLRRTAEPLLLSNLAHQGVTP
jgi:hypothetical protein